MSTADDAWQEWREGRNLLRVDRASFMAGAAWALGDAAEVVKSRFEHGRLTTDECELVETWLRDRAAGVGTKDEPLFACCGEWHSGPPCPCRCGHAYEQHTDSIGCVECKGGSCVKYVGTKDGDDDE